MFYGSGDCLVLNIPTPDSDDIPEIVRRLEEISIGCQVKQVLLTGFLPSEYFVEVPVRNQMYMKVCLVIVSLRLYRNKVSCASKLIYQFYIK